MNTSNNKMVKKILANAEKMLDDGFPMDAIPYFEEGANKLMKEESLEGVAQCYERIGYCYEFDCQWSEASEWYSKAKDVYVKAGAEARAKQAGGSAEYARSQST